MVMGLFGRSKTVDWHRKINSIAGVLHPSDEDFPYIGLQNHTGYYLKKKCKNPQDVDERLTTLINGHAFKGTAIAACAAHMSSQSLRGLLSGRLRVEPGVYFGLFPYLQSLIAANHEDKAAVSDLDAQWARELLVHSVATTSHESPRQKLERIVSLTSNGWDTRLLLYDHAQILAQNMCVDFATRLETLRDESRWMEAWTATKWLTQLSFEFSSGSSALLDQYIPYWRAWAAWQPNIHRLRKWENASLNSRHRLHNFLRLEGPDIASSKYSTLQESLIARGSHLPQAMLHWQSVQVELRIDPFLDQGNASEARRLLDRLADVVDATCWAGNDYTTLVELLCVDKIISADVLQILEDVQSFDDRGLVAAVLQACTIPIQKAETDDIKELMLALNDPRRQALRKYLTPYIVERMSNYIEQLQHESRTQSTIGQSDGVEIRFMAFTQALQKVHWILPMLDASVRALILNGPSFETTETLKEIRIAVVQNTTIPSDNRLKNQIDEYCKTWLDSSPKFEQGLSLLIEALVSLWQQDPSRERRDLAIKVGAFPDTAHAAQCLRQTMTLHDDFVSAVLLLLDGSDEDACPANVTLVRLLASDIRPEVVGCWRVVLQVVIEEQDIQLLNYGLAQMRAGTWLEWLADVRSIFVDLISWYSPGLLSLELHNWSEQLNEHLPTLSRLEGVLKSDTAMHCLLKGSEKPTNDILLRILAIVGESRGSHYQELMETVVESLTIVNASDVEIVLLHVSKTTAAGADGCVRGLECCQQSPKEYAEVLTSAWLHKDDLCKLDRTALRTLAGLFGVNLDANDEASANSLELAAQHLNEQYEELLAEARRLENMRLSLQAVDPDAVSRILTKLEIKAPSIIDDMLATLPTELLLTIEKVGQNEIEMQFPLSNLTALQREAMGAGDSQSLLVRLVIGNKDIPPGFCIHLSNTSQSGDDDQHTPWLVFKDDCFTSTAPNAQFCRGRPSRGAYQLSRLLWRNLDEDGFKSLEDTYTVIASGLTEMARSCVICGWAQGVRLRRSTICQAPHCKYLFSTASLEVLLADIWQRPTVVDLLLTMVHATAMTKKLDLLTDCPIKDAQKILQMLTDLPPIAGLARLLSPLIEDFDPGFQLTTFLKCYSANSTSTELAKLLVWACNSYRGFLTAATGQLRIPSLPGAHQFLLASAPPELELAFAANMVTTAGTSTVLFHGTSLDRLHAILCQGLRVCSGTALQRNGASWGNGVYMAEDPMTAWGYAKTAASGTGGANTGWKGSAFHDLRVLLGCELSGATTPAVAGIHVITDPSRLMVRYLFLMAPTARMPIAGHVVPAMQSVFASLRSGAI